MASKSALSDGAGHRCSSGSRLILVPGRGPKKSVLRQVPERPGQTQQRPGLGITALVEVDRRTNTQSFVGPFWCPEQTSKNPFGEVPQQLEEDGSPVKRTNTKVGKQI